VEKPDKNASDEREAIVAYLRRQSLNTRIANESIREDTTNGRLRITHNETASKIYDFAANAVERGFHWDFPTD